MLIRCIKGFKDFEAKVWRSEGDVWEASPERLAHINGTRYGKMAEVVETSQNPPEVAQEPRSTATRKASTAQRKRTSKTPQKGE